MRWFMYFSLCVGCSQPTSQPTVDAGGTYALTVHWVLETTPGMVQPCPTGFDTAEVVIAGNRAQILNSQYPCADAKAHVVFSEDPRNQADEVEVTILDAATRAMFGHGLATIPRPVPSDLTVIITTDTGRLHLHWTISQSGTASTCEQVGVSTVSIDVTTSSGPPWTLTIACNTYDAPTGDLASGPAHIALTAGSATGAADATVPSGGPIVDVPPIDLAF